MSDKLILVVDDDPDIRMMLVDLLQSHNFAVRAAGNGSEALKLVNSTRPDLVILDQWMPILNGAGFVRELNQRHINVPILVMTAAPNPVQIAEELGAEDYVQKPFELFDLLDSVRRLCSDRRASARSGRGRVQERPASIKDRPRLDPPYDASSPNS